MKALPPEVARWLGANGSVERKPTGMHDIDGKEIYLGDIVEFYFDIVEGPSKEPGDNYTCMRDIVAEIDGAIYFLCRFGGAFAFRYVDYCRVIGTDPALIDT